MAGVLSERDEGPAESIPDGASPAVFALPARADIAVAAELRDRLIELLDEPGEVTIACDAVERIDTTAIECLAALARTLQRDGRVLTLIDQSEAFERAVQLLGAEDLLGPGHAGGDG